MSYRADSSRADQGFSAWQAGLPLSIPEHVRQLIRRAIIDGEIAPGGRISEEDLAKSFGVSRTPVREAMRLLEAEGLIVLTRGRGATVAELMTDRDAGLLFNLRIEIEPELVRRVPELSPAELDGLKQVHAELVQSVHAEDGELDLRPAIALDADFHWRIYSRAAAAHLIAIARSYWSQLLRELSRTDDDATHPVRFSRAHDPLLEQHVRILAALDDQDFERAGELMAEHLTDAWMKMKAPDGR